MMLSMLKPGYAKIMSQFYKEKGATLHIREIARRTGLHIPSTHRILHELERENILQSQADGNLKKFFVKHNSRTHLIFEMFDVDRFENLPSIRRNAIKTYLACLGYRPVFAVLFGSTARETFRPDSDIDLLIVANTKINLQMAEKEAHAIQALQINAIQITYKELITELKMKTDRVVQSAVHHGYPLINHLEYYTAIAYERI